MFGDEYTRVEAPAIEQFQRWGWDYVQGDALSPEASEPERGTFKDVVLEARLRAAIRRINPWINETNLHNVVRDLLLPQVTTLMEANQHIYETLVGYTSVEQDLGKGKKGQTVKIIDFDNPANNEYLVVNQFKIAGPNQNIIPDIVLFVNGLPLAVIECKSPYITNPMEAGINQLMRYANLRNPHEDEGAERLFWYNQMMVSTHRDKARVGTISSLMEHYLEWKDPYPMSKEEVGAEASGQDVMLAGMFRPENLLDLMQSFTVYEVMHSKTLKKIARYQQYRAVHKTIGRLKTKGGRKDRGGVIWHTQGSGKSLTMVFLAMKMRRDAELKDYKLVFVTDRTQLDAQLTATFQRTQGETVFHARSVKQLKELLAKDSSDLVTAMVQKFQEAEKEVAFTELNPSDKVLVLIDEAHRTHYGTLAMNLNIALPNAPKIAFTGTPLIKSEKTINEFGSYIDTYTIEKAVEDGATVQILYEGREAKTKVTGDSLDALFDAYFADKSKEEKAAIKQKYGTERAVLEAPQRIRWICLDIIRHYKEHIEPNGFKAMIVTNSRNAAVTYKEMLDEVGGPASEAIISGDHNDPQRLQPYTDSTRHKKAIEDFNKPLAEAPLSVLIVKDMLLTGFDAPVCQVMYLDRKLTDHTLLQAIARVNRTYENKTRGFIVDYYGLSDYLTEALEMFSTEDVAGALKSIKDELSTLKARHTRVMRYFKDVDASDIDACVMTLKDDETRQQFEIDLKKFMKSMDIILPDPAAAPFTRDMFFLGKVNHAAKNLYREEALDLSGCGEKVRKLIDEHLYATGVDPKIPPINLLAANFEEAVNAHKSPRAKASEMEHAIKQHITINLENDPAYYRKLSERLKEIIDAYHDRWEEMAEQLELFRADIRDAHGRGADDLGMNETEFASYNLLDEHSESFEAAEPAPDTQAMAKELVGLLDERTDIVGFFHKYDEVKRLRRDIGRMLLDAGVELSGRKKKALVDSFMELARTKFGSG